MQSLVNPLAELVSAVGASGTLGGVLRWLVSLMSPDRWLLWLGVLFVLSVYHFPAGVVGRLRR
jgi:branched-chain amino acid transport system permease protein